jgi:3-oxoadipate enol-lactonase
MGGTIAQHIASHYQEAIGKLVLIATAAKWREATLQGLRSLLLLRQKGLDFDTLFKATLPWIFGQAFLSDAKKIQMLQEAMINNPYPQSLTNQERQYNVLTPWDGRAQLNKITAPTLIMQGTQDLISLPSNSYALKEQIPHSSLITLNCAHNFFLEEPTNLVKELLAFL